MPVLDKFQRNISIAIGVVTLLGLTYALVRDPIVDYKKAKAVKSAKDFVKKGVSFLRLLRKERRIKKMFKKACGSMFKGQVRCRIHIFNLEDVLLPEWMFSCKRNSKGKLYCESYAPFAKKNCVYEHKTLTCFDAIARCTLSKVGMFERKLECKPEPNPARNLK